jgi:inhibitor of KinA sporulation pathway (predicted exonuclease)
MSEYYLCVLDFEATCWQQEDHTKSREEMEIIEFPSVLYRINEHGRTVQLVSEFHQYVRPTLHPQLSAFCTELTGIEQPTVDAANTIEVVYAEHTDWLVQHVPVGSKFLFATCGNWDLATQLPREMINKHMKLKCYYRTFVNVKTEYEQFYKRKARSMDDMFSFLQLDFVGRLHSGIDDTRNIAKIILRLVADGLRWEQFQIRNVNMESVYME